MKIEKIQLKNFRKFDTLTVEFGPGVNVIVGPNEQGKSTIVHALIAGLFYDPLKKAKAEILQNQKWGNDKLYTIMITFRVGEDEYFLSKDFENHALLLRGPEGQAWRTFPEVADKLRELTGFSEPSLYRSSALILQNKVAEIHSSRSELAKVLQELVSSDKENVNVLTVLRSLDREIRALKKGWGSRVTDPGPLRHAKDELERIIAERTDAELIVSDVRRRIEENQKHQKKRRLLIEKLRVSERLLEENKVLFDVRNESETLKENFKKIEQRIRRIEDVEKKLETIEGQDEWLGFEKADPEAALQVLTQVFSEQREPVAPPQVFKNTTFLIGVVIAGMGVILTILGALVYPALLIFSVCIVLGLGIALRARKHGQQKQQKENHAKSNLLKKFGVSTPEEFMKKITIFRKWKEELQSLRVTLTTLLQEHSREQLEDERMKVSLALLALENKQKDIDVQKTLSPHELSRLEQEVADMKREQDEIEEQMIGNSALIQSAQKTEADLSSLVEQEEEAKTNLNRYQSTLHIYELIRDNLEEAQTTTMTSVRDVLQEKIEIALPRITHNRYSKVRVSPELDIEIFIPELNDFVAPENHVSQGTIDQIYLVARFALVEAQAEGKAPPLILDDPFVTFDPTRKAAAMELLRDLSQDFQILLFTYSNEYNERADTIIDFTTTTA